MKKPLVTCLAIALVSCTGTQVSSPPSVPGGHPRFELFGMLDEYVGRRLEDGFIESFYPDESAKADHFEAVLREFCVDETIPAHWHRRTQRGGHITFTGRTVAAAINRSYPQRDGLAWFPAGTLDPEVFRNASRADMLRYVVGAYVRRGDPESRHRALFCAANVANKFPLLANVLRRLGCEDIRVYNNVGSGMIPHSYFLTFRPTAEIRSLTGITREIAQAELHALTRSKLKQIQVPRLP